MQKSLIQLGNFLGGLRHGTHNFPAYPFGFCASFSCHMLLLISTPCNYLLYMVFIW